MHVLHCDHADHGQIAHGLSIQGKPDAQIKHQDNRDLRV